MVGFALTASSVALLSSTTANDPRTSTPGASEGGAHESDAPESMTVVSFSIHSWYQFYTTCLIPRDVCPYPRAPQSTDSQMTCGCHWHVDPGNDFQYLFLVMCGGCAAAGQLLLQIGFIFAFVVRHQLLKPISQGQTWRSWQRLASKLNRRMSRSTTIPIPLIFWYSVKPVHALAAFASFSTFTIATLSRRLPTCPAVAYFLAPAFAWTFPLPPGTPGIRVSFYRAVFPTVFAFSFHPFFATSSSFFLHSESLCPN